VGLYALEIQNRARFLPLLASAALHFALLGNFLLRDVPTKPTALGHWVEIDASPVPAPLTKKTRAPQAPASAEETAGETAVAKAAASAQSAAGKSGDTPATLRDHYLFELESFFNSRKIYPARARHLGLEGNVEVSFHLEEDGTFSDPHVSRPCIHDVLNDAALRLVKDVGHYRPLPPELNLRVLHVTVPIQYELN
jgi:TonB family protein